MNEAVRYKDIIENVSSYCLICELTYYNDNELDGLHCPKATWVDGKSECNYLYSYRMIAKKYYE